MKVERRSNAVEIDIRRRSIQSEDAQRLIALLDEELLADYPAEHVHCVEFDTFHAAGGVFAVAYENGEPVGCGALRPYNGSQVEIKRMFVLPSRRGRGISRLILEWLEAEAKTLGFSEALLETGDRSKAAVGLYESAGYCKIKPFGEYSDGPYSVCYGKRLSE